MNEENAIGRELRIRLNTIAHEAAAAGNDDLRHNAKMLYFGATLYARAARDGERLSEDELKTACGEYSLQ